MHTYILHMTVSASVSIVNMAQIVDYYESMSSENKNVIVKCGGRIAEKKRLEPLTENRYKGQ